MVNLDQYKSVEALRKAIVSGSCTKDDLLDWEYEEKISSWLERIDEHECAENLRTQYNKTLSDDELYTVLLRSLSFTDEDIGRFGNGTFSAGFSQEPRNAMDVLQQKIEDIRRLLVGSISLFPLGGIPEGWLPCEGQLLSKEYFKKLYLRLGDTYNDSGCFALPDLSSQFSGKGVIYCIFTGEEKIDQEHLLDPTFMVNDVSFTMVRVKMGTFQMGSDADNDSKPIHSVSLSTYYMGQYPVTQSLWKAVMDGNNPFFFKGDMLPVESVSWDDCQEFIRRLNKMTGTTFRLPTEAEWEFAARGGVRSKGTLYSGSDDLDKVGWFDGNSDDRTHPVGQKLSNELGLYDMSGNVWEWCQDWYNEDYYSSSPDTNPTGPASDSDRVYRGGSWSLTSGCCAVSYRNGLTPDDAYNRLGFRLAFACSSK